ncbi:MAG TPA: hypothetical protein VGK56_20585, partial [Anaerolineales bacterium]
RCLEAYETAGSAGIGHWLLKIVIREAISIYREYMEMATELFENHRDAQGALSLGMLFLAGTWLALLFVLPSSSTVGSLGPGAALVLINALLVARSLTRSERIEYVAGMAAMANTVLIASLIGAQASLGSLPLAAILVQVALIGLHGLLLWRLRGEDLAISQYENKIGEQA